MRAGARAVRQRARADALCWAGGPWRAESHGVAVARHGARER